MATSMFPSIDDRPQTVVVFFTASEKYKASNGEEGGGGGGAYRCCRVLWLFYIVTRIFRGGHPSSTRPAVESVTFRLVVRMRRLLALPLSFDRLERQSARSLDQYCVAGIQKTRGG